MENKPTEFDEEYQVPFERPDWDSPKYQLSSQQKQELLEKGYVVVDNFFPPEYCSALRQEIVWLNKHQLLKPNQIQFLPSQSTERVTVTKPHIFECDLFDEPLRSRLHELQELYFEPKWVKNLASSLQELQLNPQLGHYTIKLQLNEGGGAFPLHYDNPAWPDKRKLTCILYLNPLWKEGDGGELVLWPFLEESIKIPPLNGRMVFFLSEKMLHAVSEAIKERVCLTFWFDGFIDQNAKFEGSFYSLRELKEKISKSTIQRKFSRALYDSEYKESIKICMKERPEEMNILLESHRLHVESLKQDKQIKPILDLLLKIKSNLNE